MKINYVLLYTRGSKFKYIWEHIIWGMNKESEECVVNSVFFFIHSAVMAPLSPSLVSVYTLLLYEAGEDILKK